MDFSQLIHVDWDAQWIDKNFPAQVALIGDVPSTLKTILNRLQPSSLSDRRLMWIKEMRIRLEGELKKIREAHMEMQYLDVIRGLLPREGTLVIIGVKTACPERPVLALIGDGGFLYGAQELATCMRHKIGFPVIVVNDNAYGVISYLQRGAYQKVYESDLTNPDFVALGRAYGAEGIRVDSPSTLEAALKGALASQDLWVIELVIPSVGPPFPQY
jgi:thiamine pyrophosphate-dependent acetolactate synthase large subunit-like protein